MSTLLLVFLVLSTAPWWVAGRYSIPARERMRVGEMDAGMILGTFVRGARWFIPHHLR